MSHLMEETILTTWQPGISQNPLPAFVRRALWRLSFAAQSLKCPHTETHEGLMIIYSSSLEASTHKGSWFVTWCNQEEPENLRWSNQSNYDWNWWWTDGGDFTSLVALLSVHEPLNYNHIKKSLLDFLLLVLRFMSSYLNYSWGPSVSPSSSQHFLEASPLAAVRPPAVDKTPGRCGTLPCFCFFFAYKSKNSPENNK